MKKMVSKRKPCSSSVWLVVLCGLWDVKLDKKQWSCALLTINAAASCDVPCVAILPPGELKEVARGDYRSGWMFLSLDTATGQGPASIN